MILQSGSSGFESQEYTQYGNLKKIVYPGFKTWIKGSWEVFFINRIWMEWNEKSKFLKSVMVKRVTMMNNERGMYFPFYDIFVTTAQINDWSTVFLTRSLNSSWKWYEWKIWKFRHVSSSSFSCFCVFFSRRRLLALRKSFDHLFEFLFDGDSVRAALCRRWEATHAICFHRWRFQFEAKRSVNFLVRSGWISHVLGGRSVW